MLPAAFFALACAISCFCVVYNQRCKHEYKNINVYSDTSGSMPVATKYVQECRLCGKIRSHEV